MGKIALGPILGLLLVLASPAVAPASSAAGAPGTTRVLFARGWVRAPKPHGAVEIVGAASRLLAFAPESCRSGVSACLWVSRNGQAWNRVILRSPAFRSGDNITGVSGAGGHFLLIGWRRGPRMAAQSCPGMSRLVNPPTHYQSLAWVSTNGSTWQRASIAVPVAYAAAGGDGLIALVGPRGLPVEIQSPTCPVGVWTSHDGVSWRQLPGAARPFALGAVTSLTRGGPGLVAGGIVSKGPGHPASRAAIWTSRDGRRWTEVPNDHQVFGAFGGPMSVSSVRVVAGSHGLLALGTGLDSLGNPVFAWASRDGTHWRRAVTTPFNVGDVLEGRIVGSQAGFVGFDDEGGEAVVWSSSDGLTWTRVGSDELFGGTARVTGAAAFRDGVAAVGSFAVHPQPACLGPGAARGFDLRRFADATFLWSQGQSRAAPPPRIDQSDPRILKLLPQDLPSSLRPSQGSYRGAYVNLCADDPALGRHRAYLLMFGQGLRGLALSADTESGSAPAADAFQHASQLVAALGSLTAEETVTDTILSMREVPVPLRIGQETRLFTLKVKEQICDAAEGAVSVLQCGSIRYTTSVVVWRQARVIGVVASGPVKAPCSPGSRSRCVVGGQNLALRLAQRQLAHLRHPSLPG
ncbi:MAG TPA: hypothetical protein VFB58_05640 [Chloroflexota bacterium]|nr:hypothetical protein [Chloroflexota bacterium]